jgi:periplasmic copper chaperone A
VNPRHVVVAALVSVTATVMVASPALAHIDPDPTEAQAGSELSVGFTVEHGCEGAPTVQLDMRLPDGVTNPVPEPPDTWTGSVDGNVVTFQGGPLPDDQELTFRVRMVLPPTPDATIYFPFVQRCEIGEIRWIDVPTDDTGAELDEPAPAMQLFGPVATTVPAPTTASASATTSAPTAALTATTSIAAIATTPDTTEPSTSATATSAASTTDPVSIVASASSGDGGSTGTVVFLLALVAVAVVAAIVVIQARRRP